MQQTIKKNAKVRHERVALGESDNYGAPTLPSSKRAPNDNDDGGAGDNNNNNNDDDEYEEVEGQDGEDEAGVLAGFRRRKKTAKKKCWKPCDGKIPSSTENNGPILRRISA